jgi:hypothetical protein
MTKEKRGEGVYNVVVIGAGTAGLVTADDSGLFPRAREGEGTACLSDQSGTVRTVRL